MVGRAAERELTAHLDSVPERSHQAPGDGVSRVRAGLVLLSLLVSTLVREMGFRLVPCAAWTEAMADERREKLSAWRVSRAGEFLDG